MKRWRAVVPIKLGCETKSRLAGLLSPTERCALGERMARHVLLVLETSGLFESIVVLAPDRPNWCAGAWARDQARGLNAELAAWRADQGAAPMLVIHADLPLLTAAEVAGLLAAAESGGIALASDRAGIGSNALAIADGRDFTFRFGPDSRQLHAVQARATPVVAPMGLAADLDTPEDARFIAARGFALDEAKRDFHSYPVNS